MTDGGNSWHGEQKFIQGAGDIVVRRAIVQRSKDQRWVLPRGKLRRNERHIIGARREVETEAGHRVRAHEFLGSIACQSGDRLRFKSFWKIGK
jgi:8-oxo-dGTP diphosphatase